MIDLEKKDDRITFILHESYHHFNKNECELGSPHVFCTMSKCITEHFVDLVFRQGKCKPKHP